MKLLQANWIHPPHVESWLRQMSIGNTLNVCCGMSYVGNVRVDIDSNTNRTEPGDLFNLKFKPLSFDTVICDPPFEYYVSGDNRFRWMQKLGDLTKKRLMISVKGNSIYLGKKNWKRTLWYSEDNKMFLRLYWVFDRINNAL